MENEPEFLRIRNWDRYQVYHDGRPMLFFAVHAVSDPKKERIGIFDDPVFLRLADEPDCPVFHMMGLATRTGNKILNDPEWIARVCYCTRGVNVEKMLNAGFLESHPDSRTKPYESVPRVEQSRVEKPLAAKRLAAVGGEGNGKQRDLLWDALVEELGTSPATRTERGAWNKAVKDLREAGATADEIRTRCSVYRSRWPGVSLTPPALTKHWGSLAGTHGELSAEERNRRWLADLEARGVE